MTSFTSKSNEIPCLLKDVGVDQLNQQHLRLAAYAVDVHILVNSLAGREVTIEDWRHVDSLFGRVTRYVATHFADEEKLMVDHGYPKYDSHKVLHIKFNEKLMDIQDDIRARNLRFAKSLPNLLWDFLYTHINGEDTNYRAFFIEKGVGD